MAPARPAPSPAGLRKMIVIGPAAFLTSIGIGSVNLGMIFILKEVFSAAPTLVGWFGAVYSLAYFLSCLTLRRLTARLVPRSSMLVTLVTAASAFFIFSLFPSPTGAFVFNSITGLSMAFFWPPLMGWVSRGLEGKELSKATALFSFSWSMGSIVSPYLAGALSQRGKFLPIYFAVVVFLLNAVYVYLSRGFLADSDERPVQIVSAPEGPDLSTRLRFPAWAGVFALYAATGILANIFPLFARGEVGLSESNTGLLITFRGAAITAGFVFFGRSSFWQFRRALLVLPTLLTVVFAIIMIVAGVSVPFLCIGLLGLGFTSAWAYNNSMFYGASGALDRDRRMTIHEALLTSGQVIGSLAGGLLYQIGSMGFAFLFIAVLAAAGGGFQLYLLRYRMGVPTAPEVPASRRRA